MYYPIIDKLREIMTDITSVKEKEPLVIEGIITSATEGTWTGSYSDITSAFSNNRQVLFKILVEGYTVIVPIFGCSPISSTSVFFPFSGGGKLVNAYGVINANNTFVLHSI